MNCGSKYCVCLRGPSEKQTHTFEFGFTGVVRAFKSDGPPLVGSIAGPALPERSTMLASAKLWGALGGGDIQAVR